MVYSNTAICSWTDFCFRLFKDSHFIREQVSYSFVVNVITCLLLTSL